MTKSTRQMLHEQIERMDASLLDYVHETMTRAQELHHQVYRVARALAIADGWTESDLDRGRCPPHAERQYLRMARAAIAAMEGGDGRE